MRAKVQQAQGESAQATGAYAIAMVRREDRPLMVATRNHDATYPQTLEDAVKVATNITTMAEQADKIGSSATTQREGLGTVGALAAELEILAAPLIAKIEELQAALTQQHTTAQTFGAIIAEAQEAIGSLPPSIEHLNGALQVLASQNVEVISEARAAQGKL